MQYRGVPFGVCDNPSLCEDPPMFDMRFALDQPIGKSTDIGVYLVDDRAKLLLTMTELVAEQKAVGVDVLEGLNSEKRPVLSLCVSRGVYVVELSLLNESDRTMFVSFLYGVALIKQVAFVSVEDDPFRKFLRAYSFLFHVPFATLNVLPFDQTLEDAVDERFGYRMRPVVALDDNFSFGCHFGRRAFHARQIFMHASETASHTANAGPYAAAGFRPDSYASVSAGQPNGAAYFPDSYAPIPAVQHTGTAYRLDSHAPTSAGHNAGQHIGGAYSSAAPAYSVSASRPGTDSTQVYLPSAVAALPTPGYRNMAPVAAKSVGLKRTRKAPHPLAIVPGTIPPPRQAQVSDFVAPPSPISDNEPPGLVAPVPKPLSALQQPVPKPLPALQSNVSVLLEQPQAVPRVHPVVASEPADSSATPSTTVPKSSSEMMAELIERVKASKRKAEMEAAPAEPQDAKKFLQWFE